eukprot:11208800-Lingulodinium_polyedra.AAC.1
MQVDVLPRAGRFIVVSVDIVYGEMGNLLSPEAVGCRTHCIIQRRAVGLAVGPFCESWSAAGGKGPGPRK